MHIGGKYLALSPDLETACIDRSTLALILLNLVATGHLPAKQGMTVGPNQASLFIRRFGFMMPHGR
jgi:hypothetical protein